MGNARRIIQCDNLNIIPKQIEKHVLINDIIATFYIDIPSKEKKKIM